MANWYDDLVKRSREIIKSNDALSSDYKPREIITPQLPELNTPTSETANINKLDTTIDTTGLKNINTDLTGVKEDITQAGRGITKEDIEKYQDLRPDNKYEDQLDSAISGVRSYAEGTSPVDRTIANSYLGRFDASQAAANISQAQRIASNPNLSQSAKTAGIMEVNRTAGNQRAELVGDLAQQAQERAYTATGKLADLALNAAMYKEGQFKTILESIGNDLNRELTAKINVGELTKAEAALKLDKYNSIINATVQQKQLDLQKLTNLDNIDMAAAELGLKRDISQADIDLRAQEQGISSEEFAANLGLEYDKLNVTKDEIAFNVAAKMAELQNTQIDTWQTTAANAILEAKSSNPNITAEEIMKDPYTYQALVNTYQAITMDGTKPSEAWISSFMNKVKTESESIAEYDEQTMADLRQSMIEAGASEEDIDDAINFMDLYHKSDGLIKVNDDNSISFLGVDGKPIITFGESTNTTSTISSYEAESTLANIFDGDTVSSFVEDINSNKVISADAFISKLKSKLGDNWKSYVGFEDTAKAFYENVKNGNIKGSEESVEELTTVPFEGDVWSTQANKIIGSDNKEVTDQKNYIIDERVNEIVNGYYIPNGAITDKATFNKLYNAVPEWKPEMEYDSGGFWRVDERRFKNAPAVDSIVKYGDSVYKVVTGATMQKKGQNSDVIQLMDLKDGTVKNIKIEGKSNSNLKVTGF